MHSILINACEAGILSSSSVYVTIASDSVFKKKKSYALDCSFNYLQGTPPPLIWHLVKLSLGGSKHLAGAF